MELSLGAWGWDQKWAEQLGALPAGSSVGRVVGQERTRWDIQTAHGLELARIPSATKQELYPVVGDWALVKPGPMPSDPWSILAVLPRRTWFSRGAALTGATEQVLAANIDTVWIAHGLDRPLNPRSIERYLALAWESGAVPEIVLTKADLAELLEPTIA